MTFNGISIQVTPDIPRMRLSEDLPVTPEFRREFDAWLRDFFGTTNAVADGTYLGLPGSQTVLMNPRTYARFKAALKDTK